MNKTWKNRTCEICNNHDWILNDTIFEISEFQVENISLGGGIKTPIFTMTCNSCGNTKIMNAFKLDIIDPINLKVEN